MEEEKINGIFWLPEEQDTFAGEVSYSRKVGIQLKINGFFGKANSFGKIIPHIFGLLWNGENIIITNARNTSCTWGNPTLYGYTSCSAYYSAFEEAATEYNIKEVEITSDILGYLFNVPGPISAIEGEEKRNSLWLLPNIIKLNDPKEFILYNDDEGDIQEVKLCVSLDENLSATVQPRFCKINNLGTKWKLIVKFKSEIPVEEAKKQIENILNLIRLLTHKYNLDFDVSFKTSNDHYVYSLDVSTKEKFNSLGDYVPLPIRYNENNISSFKDLFGKWLAFINNYHSFYKNSFICLVETPINKSSLFIDLYIAIERLILVNKGEKEEVEIWKEFKDNINAETRCNMDSLCKSLQEYRNFIAHGDNPRTSNIIKIDNNLCYINEWLQQLVECLLFKELGVYEEVINQEEGPAKYFLQWRENTKKLNEEFSNANT
jgi:hypothetical protein